MSSLMRPITEKADMVPAGSKLGVIKGIHNLPPGAVMLTRGQMLDITTNVISKWNPKEEMYSLTYGPHLIAAWSALVGGILNNHFRGQFKLRGLNRMVSFAPTVVIPAVTSSIIQSVLVVDPIILDELSCPVCAETRAVSYQLVTGLVQPILLGYFSCAIIAKNNFTTKVPPITDVKATLGQFSKFCKPIAPHLAALLALNVSVTSYIVYLQGKTGQKVRDRVFGQNVLEKLDN